jgi:hypothetical protein
MKYKKKPVEITAELNEYEPRIIHTLEGDHLANIGDWIITGVQGELYPCKPDIFQQTYEPVDDEAKAKWQEVYEFLRD